jgi:hypothetical protein
VGGEHCLFVIMAKREKLKELLTSLEVQHPLEHKGLQSDFEFVPKFITEKTLREISDLLPSVSNGSNLLLESNLLPAIAHVSLMLLFS